MFQYFNENSPNNSRRKNIKANWFIFCTSAPRHTNDPTTLAVSFSGFLPWKLSMQDQHTSKPARRTTPHTPSRHSKSCSRRSRKTNAYEHNSIISILWKTQDSLKLISSEENLLKNPKNEIKQKVIPLRTRQSWDMQKLERDYDPKRAWRVANRTGFETKFKVGAFVQFPIRKTFANSPPSRFHSYNNKRQKWTRVYYDRVHRSRM